MGYDPALVARGGAIICVPCLRREGRSPAAAVHVSVVAEEK
jgi:hypothetical protein